MISRYEQLSGFVPEKESDIMLRLRVLAGELYSERAYADFILRQSFPTTAQGEYLDAHAKERGLVRKKAEKAVGKVIFTANDEEHGDIIIPAGTVVGTKSNFCRFVTDSDATLSSSSSKVTVSVTAAETGSAYNVGVARIGVIVTPVLGIASVTNLVRFTGGSESESDEELRQRIAYSFQNISNGTNAAYYRDLAMTVDGVYSACAVGKARGTGTVNVYICGRGTAASSDTVAKLQKMFNKARELNVDVKVLSATAESVSFYINIKVEDGYEFSAVSEQLKAAVIKYIGSLGIGCDVLMSNIGEVVHHIRGISDYSFNESYGADHAISNSRFPIAGNILVGSK